MKKKTLKTILIFTVIWNCSELWAAPDLFNNYSHYFTYEKQTFTTGLKVDLSMAEGRCAIDSKCNYNYGLSLFSDNYLKDFPMECQVGNLSIGGIISKLNNPLIDSSVSGFGSCYSPPSIITSSLPSYTSFSKPFSTFVEAGWENKKYFVRDVKINGVYTPETKDLSFSTKIGLCLTDNIKLTNTSCFCFFTLRENNSNSWYLDIPYYKESNSLNFANQLELELFNFSSNFSIFCYKSPFPEKNYNHVIENIYRMENKFKTNNFSISLCTLFNNSPFIISRDNKILNPCTQIKMNIQYCTDIKENKDFSIKTGLSSYFNIPSKEKIKDDLKFGISTSVNFPLTKVLVEGNFSYNLFEDEGNVILKFVSTNIENSWNIDFFSPTVGISSQYYISSKNFKVSPNYKIKLCFNFWDNTLINDNSFSFSIRDNICCDMKVKTGININFLYKKLLICGKITGEFRI